MSGWYVVYILMIAANAVMCHFNGFSVLTWQYWVWSVIVILTYISGANNRDWGDLK